MLGQDLRLEKGAYITDGRRLFEVVGYRIGPGMMGIRTARFVVEDCRDLELREFAPDTIRSAFALVRRAPSPQCPDHFDQIPWEASPAGAIRAADVIGRARAAGDIEDAWPQAA